MAPPDSNLILDFDGFGLRCLQLNTLKNYSVAADRVVVAAELDKFSRNMNSPAEWDRYWRIPSSKHLRGDNGDREMPLQVILRRAARVRRGLDGSPQTDGAHAHSAAGQRYPTLIECMSKRNF
jgi:hypothetical protein